MTQTGFNIPVTNSTSSYIPFNNDWNENDALFDRGFTSPETTELFSELSEVLGCSIYQDIKLFENHSDPFDVTSEIYEKPKDNKIRNHDCMWSGATISNATLTNNTISTAIKREPIDIIDVNNIIKIEPGEIDTDSEESQDYNNHHQNSYPNQHKQQQKQNKSKLNRMNDDSAADIKHAVHMQQFENQQLLQQQKQQHHQTYRHQNHKMQQQQLQQQLQQQQQTIEDELTNILYNNNKHNNTVSKQQKHQQQNMQSIPAGASLLISSHMNQQKKGSNNNRQLPIQIPTLTPMEFIRDREHHLSISSNDGNNNISNNCNGGISIGSNGGMNLCRPDTPLSLDDDAPEFKHSVDLAACVTGNNSLVLDNETMIINKLRAHLEDASKENIDLHLLNDDHQHHLNDVLSIISNESNCNSYRCSNKDKDYFDNNSYMMNSFNDNYLNNRFGGKNSSINRRRDGCSENSYGTDTDNSDDDDEEEDEEEEDEEEEEEDSILSLSKSSMLFASSQNTTTTLGHSVMHSDHSYTRSKDGVDVTGMGMETPSDSDEEIDVVSIGDKKLPTNPSDKDCRALLNKISARIVKTPNGLRTIPPRRRGSYDPPYTPANSITPIKSGSLASSRYPSPTSTPYSYTSSSNSTKYYSSSSSSSNSSSRKRSSATASTTYRSTAASAIDDYSPPSTKRQRSKKQKSSAPAPVKQSHRHYNVDEADTIEKRNLHNNMERQRRIGLKNLFEALKKQIPSIKDKERAPKVNILREAAKLCEQLTRDYKHMSVQQQMLQEQIRNRQDLLNRLKTLRTI